MLQRTKFAGILLITLFLISGMVVGCSASGNEQVEENDVEDVVITIGNLTDKTGVSSGPVSIIDTALEDMVEYYNDENLIPGVKLKIIAYDGQCDPSRSIPGYESLIARGADFIWVPLPPSVPPLKERADEDKYVLFAATANMDSAELEGGYIFSLGVSPEFEAYTLLEWIAENHEGFPQGRPARIGGAAWEDAYSNIWFAAARKYVEANPDKYVWEGDFQTELKFSWDREIEALKDCDYVYSPVPPHVFVDDFRDVAGEKATLIGTEVHCAFMGLIENNELWDELDGSLYIRVTPWYHETGPMIDLINQLLTTKHSPVEAEMFKDDGVTYLSAKQAYLMLDIVRKAVEKAGPENFDSQALYEAATSWSFEMEGIEDFCSFTDKKRMSQNYYSVYEASGADRNLYRVSDWMYQVTEPK
ncbi:MAG: ABC transporter substrate-binding protein [Dehalococcoidia bacterium]